MKQTLIIAEAGVNHNGSESIAIELVEAAASAGADVVKFQSFQAHSLVTKGTPKADYQKSNTVEGDQFSMLRSLELPPSSYHAILERCNSLGIEFLSTAFDVESLDFLVALGVQRLKIPSGEITNIPLLQSHASYGLPIILSTGMSTLSEVSTAVQAINQVWSQISPSEYPSLTLLHCTSNYPASLDSINLRAMNTLADAFNLPVGYSDHSEGILVSSLAVAAGATLIEKHITLDRNLPGPDHAASIDPNQFGSLVRGVRTAELVLGNPLKAPTTSELPIRDLVRRSVTLTRSLTAGSTICESDLCLLRPGTGLPPAALSSVVGKKLRRDLPKGFQITNSDIL